MPGPYFFARPIPEFFEGQQVTRGNAADLRIVRFVSITASRSIKCLNPNQLEILATPAPSSTFYGSRKPHNPRWRSHGWLITLVGHPVFLRPRQHETRPLVVATHRQRSSPRVQFHCAGIYDLAWLSQALPLERLEVGVCHKARVLTDCRCGLGLLTTSTAPCDLL